MLFFFPENGCVDGSFQEKIWINKTKGMSCMKRKVARNEAALNNKTPAESMHDHQYITQFDAENGDRGANRNSKQGKQGD